jgi:hypothetical protein
VKLLNKIKKIKQVDSENFSLTLEFQDGYKGKVKLSDLFSGKKLGPLTAEILRGNLFNKCFIESGHLAWPNGFEICADSLRIRAEQFSKDQAA